MNDLSMHLLDIVQNSVSAKATVIRIEVQEDVAHDVLRLSVGDNGKGMTTEQVNRLSDPFFTSRTTRKVGMGIPLLKQTAEQCGGGIRIRSELGVGTEVEAWFGYANIDRPPLGDVANAVVLSASANPAIRFIYTYKYNSGEYVFDTQEVNEALEGIPINDVSVVLMLQDLIHTNEDEIRGI